jgi:hypothetical protein
MHGNCETRDHENGKRKPKAFGQEYLGDLENRHVLLTFIDERGITPTRRIHGVTQSDRGSGALPSVGGMPHDNRTWESRMG